MNVMKTQAQISDEMSEETMSKVVADKISVILEKAFKPFKLEEVIIKFPPDYNESLNSFLLQVIILNVEEMKIDRIIIQG